MRIFQDHSNNASALTKPVKDTSYFGDQRLTCKVDGGEATADSKASPRICLNTEIYLVKSARYLAIRRRHLPPVPLARPKQHWFLPCICQSWPSIFPSRWAGLESSLSRQRCPSKYYRLPSSWSYTIRPRHSSRTAVWCRPAGPSRKSC